MAENTPITQQLVHTPAKEIGLAKPKPFNGDPRNLEKFLMNCDIYLTTNEGVYDANHKKISFLLSLLSKGPAEVWKQQWYKANKAANAGAYVAPTLPNFLQQLIGSFKEVDEEGSALLRLERIKQGTKTVEDHNNEFKLLKQQAKLEDEKTLINLYRRSISQQIVEKIISHNPMPNTLQGWMNKAVTLDKQWRIMKGILDQSRKKNGSGRYFHFGGTSRRDPNAMDVDALLEEDRKKQYRCFNCDQPGHFTNECKQPRKKGNFQKYQGKKGPQRDKWMPSKLRTHVRTILDEMDEEEQEEFFEEAEEQGF